MSHNLNLSNDAFGAKNSRWTMVFGCNFDLPPFERSLLSFQKVGSAILKLWRLKDFQSC